jgi:hypothetical protein
MLESDTLCFVELCCSVTPRVETYVRTHGGGRCGERSTREILHEHAKPHDTTERPFGFGSAGCDTVSKMVLLVAFALMVATALSDGGGVPSITELGSTVQRVRVCNAAAERMGCHGRPAGTWVTETSCADAGCCWFNGGGCFAPSDQRSPPDEGVVRFAAGQQPPALSNGLGEVRAPPAGELIAVTCITIPPCVSPSLPRHTHSG